MTDIIVGCITGYTFDKISTWVNSIEKSGFKGLKAMICYNVGYDVVNQLSERGFKVFGFIKNDQEGRLEYQDKNFNICVDRFLHIPFFLNQLENKEQYRYIITTDVRDVIFQRNPSEWLEKYIKNKQYINVTSECIRYKDEPWGDKNLFMAFGPYFHKQNCDHIIYNAGVISGRFQAVLDLCENIYMMCGRSPAFIEGGGGPDQAALNILLHHTSWKSITNFATSESGFAAQLGTSADPTKSNLIPFLTESRPIIDEEKGLVKTCKGELYYIVHQYDRVPTLKPVIENKYKD
jgi:hypothetical protein